MNLNFKFLRQSYLAEDFYIKKFETEDFKITANIVLPEIDFVIEFKSYKYSCPYSPSVRIVGNQNGPNKDYTFDFIYDSFTKTEMNAIYNDVQKLNDVAQYICNNWLNLIVLETKE